MPSSTAERRYARVKTPKGWVVAWQGPSQRCVSRAETMGLGGLFISTNYPPQVGTTIRVLFDVDHGEVRARAVVRSVLARRSKGMEVLATQADVPAPVPRWVER